MTGKASHSIVLTGATGFLGAFLMAGLLERGYHVTILGRSSKDKRLSDRLSDLVRWFNITDPGRGCAPLRSISRRNTWALMVRRMAASALFRAKLSTAPRIPASRNATGAGDGNNVSSLSALLDLAADSTTEHLCYVSTAYAAGIREGVCMETPLATDCFTNVYEESKAQAEGIIGRSCENRVCPFPYCGRRSCTDIRKQAQP